MRGAMAGVEGNLPTLNPGDEFKWVTWPLVHVVLIMWSLLLQVQDVHVEQHLLQFYVWWPWPLQRVRRRCWGTRCIGKSRVVHGSVVSTCALEKLTTCMNFVPHLFCLRLCPLYHRPGWQYQWGLEEGVQCFLHTHDATLGVYLSGGGGVVCRHICSVDSEEVRHACMNHYKC